VPQVVKAQPLESTKIELFGESSRLPQLAHRRLHSSAMQCPLAAAERTHSPWGSLD
jgi:hypothetical protein